MQRPRRNADTRIERWGKSVMIMPANANEMLASVAETLAEAAAAQARSDAATISVHWDVETNRWTTSLEGAPAPASATELMSGERSNRR